MEGVDELGAESGRLTPEQAEVADLLIEIYELEPYKDMIVDDMYGESGTVWYGLGRCAKYLDDMTPEQVRTMVFAKLKAQGLIT